MPRYYPDLESVKIAAQNYSRHQGDKKYTGIIPTDESDLPVARKELGSYLREVWDSELAAIEVEEAVTENDYEEKIKIAIFSRMVRSKMNERLKKQKE